MIFGFTRAYQLKELAIAAEFFDSTRLISSGLVELALCTSRL
jgi:hypothetical protein